jgi:DNA repair protein RecO (recombination protein O)
MSQFKTDGIVLSSLRLTGADKLITVLTSDRGKIVGAAAGVRRLRSRFGSALEPFSHCRLVLFRKRPDLLFRISQADILHSFQSIRENMEQIELASRMVNLIRAFTAEEIANPGLFKHLLSCLEIVEKKNGQGLLAAYFELHLLKHVGYQPKLDRCIKCQGLLEKGRCCFLASAGGVLCHRCVANAHCLPVLSLGTIALTRQLLKLDPTLLQRLKPAPMLLNELGDILEVYRLYLLDKKIFSTDRNPVTTPPRW